jgi:hypothetical protein
MSNGLASNTFNAIRVLLAQRLNMKRAALIYRKKMESGKDFN